MLASGVLAGIFAGVAFGGDWRRLANFSLGLWPILVLAVFLRAVGFLVPASPLLLYVISLFAVALVAAWNWRIPGAILVVVGTSLNLFVVLLNSGMPYDPNALNVVGIPPPNDTLHVLLTPDTRLEFLSDVIPVAIFHGVFSLGDLLVGVGGFLIPFMWLQPPAQAGRARHLRSPNFAFFWVGQVISRFGDPITLIALTFVTYQKTQSALITALAVLTATIPNALFSFVGGAIADAFGYRRVMVWCDVIRATLIAIVPMLLLLDAPLVFPFAVVLIAGLCTAVFSPARIALVPALLEGDELARGNSLVYASDRTVEVAGGIAGGLLVATIGTNAFYVDAATFALSAMLLSRVAVREVARRLTWPRLLADAREGLRLLRRSRVLWSNTVFSLAAQISTPIVNGLTPAFLIQRFAGNDAAVGAAQFGISEAAIAFGAVVGSALLPRYLATVKKGTLLVLGFAADGALIVLVALAPAFPVAVMLFALLGATNVIFYVPTVTILQEGTEPATRARVFGARIALTNLSWLPLIFISGVLADVFNPALLIGVAGAVTLAVALVGTRVRAVYEVA
jgi:MFS family permease